LKGNDAKCSGNDNEQRVSPDCLAHPDGENQRYGMQRSAQRAENGKIGGEMQPAQDAHEDAEAGEQQKVSGIEKNFRP
jgi:hypothetical protein